MLDKIFIISEDRAVTQTFFVDLIEQNPIYNENIEVSLIFTLCFLIYKDGSDIIFFNLYALDIKNNEFKIDNFLEENKLFVLKNIIKIIPKETQEKLNKIQDLNAMTEVLNSMKKNIITKNEEIQIGDNVTNFSELNLNYFLDLINIETERYFVVN